VQDRLGGSPWSSQPRPTFSAATPQGMAVVPPSASVRLRTTDGGGSLCRRTYSGCSRASGNLARRWLCLNSPPTSAALDRFWQMLPQWAHDPLGCTGAASRGARQNEPAKQLRFALDYPCEKWTMFLRPAKRDSVERRAAVRPGAALRPEPAGPQDRGRKCIPPLSLPVSPKTCGYWSQPSRRRSRRR
jgi:hypothetical protein